MSEVEQCSCERLGVTKERRCGRCRTASWSTVRAAIGVVEGAPADAVVDTDRLDEVQDCEHDTSGTEECLVAHFAHGVQQDQCRRCRKCDCWVRVPLVLVEKQQLLPRRVLFWLPGDPRS